MILTLDGKVIAPAGSDVAVVRGGDVVVIANLVFGDDDRRGLVITQARQVTVRRCRFGPIRFRPNQGWHGDAIRIEANGSGACKVLLEDIEIFGCESGVLPIHAADGRQGFTEFRLNRVNVHGCGSAAVIGTKFRCDRLIVTDSTIRIGSGGPLRPEVIVKNSEASIYGRDYHRPAPPAHPSICPTCGQKWV